MYFKRNGFSPPILRFSEFEGQFPLVAQMIPFFSSVFETCNLAIWSSTELNELNLNGKEPLIKHQILVALFLFCFFKEILPSYPCEQASSTNHLTITVYLGRSSYWQNLHKTFIVNARLYILCVRKIVTWIGFFVFQATVLCIFQR